MASKYTHVLSMLVPASSMNVGNLFCHFLDSDSGGSRTFGSRRTVDNLWLASSPVTAETRDSILVLMTYPMIAVASLFQMIADQGLPEDLQEPTQEEIIQFCTTALYDFVDAKTFLTVQNKTLFVESEEN